MDNKAKITFVSLSVLVIVAWLVSPTIGETDNALWVLPQFTLLFDSTKALQITQEFVTRFPSRVLGSIESNQSADFLRHRLDILGYQTSYSQFDATIAGHRQVGENVLALKPGSTPETLAIVTHYDTAPSTVQEATDDGSGIGVLMELARIFSESRTQRSLLFVGLDGDEWGMLGALDLARNYPERQHIAAVLSLDCTCTSDLSAMALDTVGLTGGYTPPWLRELSRMAAERERLPVVFPAGLCEHFERAIQLSWTDQGPFLSSGIPAINLRGIAKDAAKEVSVRCSPQDIIDHLKSSAVGTSGRVAERILRTLDGLPWIPRESMGAMRMKGSIYIAPRVIYFLQYMTFLPGLAGLFFLWHDHGMKLKPARLLRELLTYSGLIFPFLVLYYAVARFRLLEFVPRYSLCSPPPKDPMLVHPSLGLLGGLLALFLAAAIACYFLIKFLNRRLPQPDFYSSKLILVTMLVLICFLALRHNSYWAVSFIAVPAWIWILIGHGRGKGQRVLNRIWILAGGIPTVAIQFLFAARMGLKWKLAWYEVLALSTGMFPLMGYLLAVAIFALGIRFLTIQSCSFDS